MCHFTTSQSNFDNGLKAARTQQLSFFDHSLSVVGPLSQRFVQQGFGFLLRHGVLQAHGGKNGQGLSVSPQGLVDVIGHPHSLSDPIGCQVTINQTCDETTIMTRLRGCATAGSKRTFVTVEATGRQAHGLSEMDDGFLDAAHVSQRCPLQEEGLHTVAVQLNGLGSQVQRSGVTLTVEAVTANNANLC